MKSTLRSHVSISVDGYVAGPGQDQDDPLGVGGLRLHEWMFATDSFHEMHRTTGAGAHRIPTPSDARPVDDGRRHEGLLDELYLHVVEVVLGARERLLVDVGDPTLEPVEVVASRAVTQIRYRVAH